MRCDEIGADSEDTRRAEENLNEYSEIIIDSDKWKMKLQKKNFKQIEYICAKNTGTKRYGVHARNLKFLFFFCLSTIVDSFARCIFCFL